MNEHTFKLNDKYELGFTKGCIHIMDNDNVLQSIKFKNFNSSLRDKLSNEIVIFELFKTLKEAQIFIQKNWIEIKQKYTTSINYQTYLIQQEKEKELESEDIKEKHFEDKIISASSIQYDVQQYIHDNKRSKATEEIVQTLLSNERIYTTRDDDKPEMWIYKEGIYIPQAKTFIREFCIEVLDYMFTTTLCNEVIAKIEAKTYIDQNEFFEVRDIYKFAVENGVIDLRDNTLIDFNPDYFLFNKLPVVYDTKAICPNIGKFFKSIYVDAHDILLMQELFGFILLKDYKYEKAFMFNGTGRNGKGKTIELIKRFLGIENISSIPIQDLDKDQYSKGELHNKLANIGGDISSDSLKETNEFKGLTGHDFISANRKFKTRLHFTNYAKMIFSCNTLPMTYDTTIAFFNRWILIDFPYSFLTDEELEDNNMIQANHKLIKKPDPEIINKISTSEELSGLLNWALKGFKRLTKYKKFTYGKGTSQVAKMWIRKSNSLAAFCMDFVCSDYEGKISKSYFRKEFSNYCKEHKIKPMGDKSIAEYLSREYGVSSERFRNLDNGMDIMHWFGIRFLNEDIDDYGFSTLIENVKNPLELEQHCHPCHDEKLTNIIEEKVK